MIMLVVPRKSAKKALKGRVSSENRGLFKRNVIFSLFVIAL